MKKIAYFAPEMEILKLVHSNALLSYSGSDPNISDVEPDPNEVETD
jgi:hypothetical protein